MSITSLYISGGFKILCVASIISQIVTIQIKNIEAKAPSTSALWYPYVYVLFDDLSAIFRAITEIPIPRASDTKCAASDMIAIEFEYNPPTISTATKKNVINMTKINFFCAF